VEKTRLVCIAPVLGSQPGLSALRKAQDILCYSIDRNAEADLNHDRAWRLKKAGNLWRDETDQIRRQWISCAERMDPEV